MVMCKLRLVGRFGDIPGGDVQAEKAPLDHCYRQVEQMVFLIDIEKEKSEVDDARLLCWSSGRARTELS
jgi:hypothetical protein